MMVIVGGRISNTGSLDGRVIFWPPVVEASSATEQRTPSPWDNKTGPRRPRIYWWPRSSSRTLCETGKASPTRGLGSVFVIYSPVCSLGPIRQILRRNSVTTLYFRGACLIAMICAIAPFSNADAIQFSFSGGGITSSGTLTVVLAPANTSGVSTPNTYEITGITGTFADTNDGVPGRLPGCTRQFLMPPR
jgi:hypothetical protein